MRNKLLSLIAAGSFLISGCASHKGPFVTNGFKSQGEVGILGHQTITYLYANRDEFLDKVSVVSGKVLYHEGSSQGYSEPITLLDLDNGEQPTGVIYSGNLLNIHTTKGIHSFRTN